jgi:hypothetical protein
MLLFPHAVSDTATKAKTRASEQVRPPAPLSLPERPRLPQFAGRRNQDGGRVGASRFRMAAGGRRRRHRGIASARRAGPALGGNRSHARLFRSRLQAAHRLDESGMKKGGQRPPFQCAPRTSLRPRHPVRAFHGAPETHNRRPPVGGFLVEREAGPPPGPASVSRERAAVSSSGPAAWGPFGMWLPRSPPPHRGVSRLQTHYRRGGLA